MPSHGYANDAGAKSITITEKLQQQKRFFCEDCKREVFLNNKYCDKCGGEIEWPEQISKVLSTWAKQTKKHK